MEDAIKRYEVVISREIVDKFIEASNEELTSPMAEEIERLGFAVVHTVIQAILGAVKNGRELVPRGSPIPDLTRLHGLLRTVELLKTWLDCMPHLPKRSARAPGNPETLRTMEVLEEFGPVDRELLRQAGERVLALLDLEFRKEKEASESGREEGGCQESA